MLFLVVTQKNQTHSWLGTGLSATVKQVLGWEYGLRFVKDTCGKTDFSSSTAVETLLSTGSCSLAHPEYTQLLPLAYNLLHHAYREEGVLAIKCLSLNSP